MNKPKPWNQVTESCLPQLTASLGNSAVCDCSCAGQLPISPGIYSLPCSYELHLPSPHLVPLASERHWQKLEGGAKRETASLPVPLLWAVSLAVTVFLPPVRQPLFLALRRANLPFFLPALGMVAAPCVTNLWVTSPFYWIFQFYQLLYVIPCIKLLLKKLNCVGSVFSPFPVQLSAKRR